MKKSNTKKICIIGAGRVGTTIAAAILNANLPELKLAAISSRSRNSIGRAEKILGEKSKNIIFLNNNSECAKLADCILISTPDDLIEKITEEIVSADPSNIKGKLFIHFSGAKSLKVFETATKAGVFTASIHPIKSFASIENSISTLAGTIYGVTYPDNKDKATKEYINFLISSIGGKIVEVKDDKKSIYHAAACVASNYLVCLINYAVKIHESIGIRPEDSLSGLAGLIDGTVSNIKNLGPEKALTGPIARGDTGTVKEHLKNFKLFMKPGEEEIYKVMGKETAKIAFNNGWIKKEILEDFLNMFHEPGSIK
jgi:predicted short-subunit dehydrogenase-like oxidoreductase (DUF2520 family)